MTSIHFIGALGDKGLYSCYLTLATLTIESEAYCKALSWFLFLVALECDSELGTFAAVVKMPTDWMTSFILFHRIFWTYIYLVRQNMGEYEGTIPKHLCQYNTTWTLLVSVFFSTGPNGRTGIINVSKGDSQKSSICVSMFLSLPGVSLARKLKFHSEKVLLY